MRPSNGSIGSTIAGCWSPSATSRLPKPKINIMLPRIPPELAVRDPLTRHQLCPPAIAGRQS